MPVTLAASQQQQQMAAVTPGLLHGKQHVCVPPSSAHTALDLGSMMFAAGVLWGAAAPPSAWVAGRAALALQGRAQGPGSTSSWCSSECMQATGPRRVCL